MSMEREALEDQYERMEEALQKIKIWSEAYPLDVFPEPDMAYARALLARGGITLDAVSASCMRHVVEGVGRIAREALADREALEPEGAGYQRKGLTR